jgi:transposase
MSFYLVAGHGASTAAPVPGGHLPTARRRVYPSDTSNTEWNLIAGLVPVGGPRPAGGGRPVRYSRPDVIDAIRYVAHNGCVWRALPIDFPHPKLVYHYFTAWAADGTLSRIHDTLREQVRVAEGRQPVPTAGLIDAQSLRAAETVGRPSRGYDAGKKINGRKRHIIVDTTGLLVAILVTGAHEQDRDGGRLLLQALRMCFPSIRLIWADQGYSGTLVTWPPPASTSPCRSSANSPTRPASSYCTADGPWNAPSPGSTVADAPSATTNAGRNTTPRCHLNRYFQALSGLRWRPLASSANA